MNGMFAFALYDSRKNRLFLARDRAGEKPLFYTLADGTLRFASELKGLMSDPALKRCIDAEALDCYLSMGFVPGERCILEGVRKAAAGSCAVLRCPARRGTTLALLAVAGVQRWGRIRATGRQGPCRRTAGSA